MTSRRSLPPGSRGLRLSGAPVISVVVASQAPRPSLDACLSALVPACTARAIEVVVARSCDTAQFRDLQASWPQVLWMPAPDGATAAMLRVAGLSAADGDIVAVVDDTRARGEAWVAELSDAPRRVSPSSA